MLSTGQLVDALDRVRQLGSVRAQLPAGMVDEESGYPWARVFEDVLRGGLVLAVAALDTFTKDLVAAASAERARSSKPGSDFHLRVLPDLVETQRDRLAEAVLRGSVSLDELMERRYERHTFQSPGQLDDALRRELGLEQSAVTGAWATVDARLGAPGSRQRLAEVVRRRNEIAHGNDLEPLTTEALEKVLLLVAEVATAMAETVVHAGHRVIRLPIELPAPALVVLLAKGPVGDGRGGYWDGMTVGELVASARQWWRISDRRVQKWQHDTEARPRYLVALHRGDVVGVWEIDHTKWRQRAADGRWSMGFKRRPPTIRATFLGYPLRDPGSGEAVRGYRNPVIGYPTGHPAFR